MSILSPALLAAVGLVLLASGASHLRAPAGLLRGLRAQGVLPEGTHRPVALLLGPVEVLLGAAALVAAATGPSRTTALAVGLAAAGLFLALTVYLRRVLAVSAGEPVPCACGLGEVPVSLSTVVRAGILSAMAVTAAVTAGGWSVAAAPAVETTVAVAAALVLALSAAVLPAARTVPEAAVRLGLGLTPTTPTRRP